jgi:hypothetical protein
MITAMFLHCIGRSYHTTTGTVATMLEVVQAVTCTSAMCAYGLTESRAGQECGTLIVHIA